MKSDNTIHIKIDALKGSALEESLSAYFQDLIALRKKRKDLYKKNVEKQIKKVERSGL